MSKSKIALVVIVYNKTLKESATLQGLSRFNTPLHHLVIVNNGPNSVQKDDFFIELQQRHERVTLENYLENKPLSWIYNDLIEKNTVDYYVMFDDDTEINPEYEHHLFHGLKNTDIELPKIYARVDKVQHFPMLNEQLLQQSGQIHQIKTIFSVGSGLILSDRVKHIFTEKYEHVFDQHFAFYGVDSTFFLRLNQMIKDGYEFNICSNTYLNHGLSLTEEALTDWRKKEFIYENTLKVKYYSSSQLMSRLKFLRLMYRKLSHFEFRDLKIVIKTFMSGKHPRC